MKYNDCIESIDFLTMFHETSEGQGTVCVTFVCRLWGVVCLYMVWCIVYVYLCAVCVQGVKCMCGCVDAYVYRAYGVYLWDLCMCVVVPGCGVGVCVCRNEQA